MPRHREDTMQLQPRREPGRSDRKAAAYAAEIVRLRAEGYTFEAIREALADVGVRLSESALRREVRRHQRPAGRAGSGAQPASRTPTTATASSPPGSVPASSVPTASSGREVAEAFFNANPSNPLLRAKETP
jgi:hypothetical protein